MSGRALLLIGSAKPPGESCSEALATYLAARLAAAGVEAELVHLVRTSHRPEALIAAVDRADLIVLLSPVYVDALPYLLVQALERIAAAELSPRPRAMAAVINCGFPEPVHCQPSIRLAELFAEQVGFDWCGGLALGGGPPFAGHDITELDMADHARAALDLAAPAWAQGQPAPPEAVAEMAEPTMPRFFYMMVGNWNWRWSAMKHGQLTHLRDKTLIED